MILLGRLLAQAWQLEDWTEFFPFGTKSVLQIVADRGIDDIQEGHEQMRNHGVYQNRLFGVARLGAHEFSARSTI